LRSKTRFRRYRLRRVPFSFFARPNSFSAVPRASGPVFMFCALGLVFSVIEGVGSRFQVLRSRTHFRRYRVRRVLFSRFARPDSFSTVPRASGPVFTFFTPGLVFGATEGVVSRFHVLRARTRFRLCRVRRVSYSSFACSDSFLAVERRCVPFSYFARLDSFSAVPRVSGPVFKFCAPGLCFGGTEGVGSRFHVLRARARLGSTEGVGSRFQVLLAQTLFRRY
jgi:hypothetical protein